MNAKKDNLIKMHKLRFVKLTQYDPEIFTLCSQCTIYLTESDKKVAVKVVAF